MNYECTNVYDPPLRRYDTLDYAKAACDDLQDCGGFYDISGVEFGICKNPANAKFFVPTPGRAPANAKSILYKKGKGPDIR